MSQPEKIEMTMNGGICQICFTSFPPYGLCSNQTNQRRVWTKGRAIGKTSIAVSSYLDYGVHQSHLLRLIALYFCISVGQFFCNSVFLWLAMHWSQPTWTLESIRGTCWDLLLWPSSSDTNWFLQFLLLMCFYKCVFHSQTTFSTVSTSDPKGCFASTFYLKLVAVIEFIALLSSSTAWARCYTRS